MKWDENERLLLLSQIPDEFKIKTLGSSRSFDGLLPVEALIIPGGLIGAIFLDLLGYWMIPACAIATGVAIHILKQKAIRAEVSRKLRHDPLSQKRVIEAWDEFCQSPDFIKKW